VPILDREKRQFKIDGLKKKLVEDGWQPIECGQEWYSEKFKRQVKKYGPRKTSRI